MTATARSDTVQIMSDLDRILGKGESAEVIPLPENTKYNAEIRINCRTTRTTAERLIKDYGFDIKVNQGGNAYRIELAKYVK